MSKSSFCMRNFLETRQTKAGKNTGQRLTHVNKLTCEIWSCFDNVLFSEKLNPVQNFLRDLAEISPRLPRSRRDCRDLGEIAEISARSRQDFSEISAAKNSPGISARSRRDSRRDWPDLG